MKAVAVVRRLRMISSESAVAATVAPGRELLPPSSGTCGMVSGIEQGLVDVLVVFIIAGGVGVFVAKVADFPYTIALLLAGVGVSVLSSVADTALGAAAEPLIGLELSHDLILLVLLPPLLFEGAATTDLERFRRNVGPILALAVPGLILSVVALGAVGHFAFGVAPLVALLFAAMVMPTDPVSVLALFEELGAPERLSVLVEGESLINDGVGVVLFSTLLVLVESGASIDALLSPVGVAEVAAEVVVVSGGGLLVGLGAGYVIHSVMVTLDEHMTEIVLTILLAYGSFILAEHYLGVSGVIATVVAGLFMGNRGAEYAMSPRTKVSVFNTWETGAFVVNTFIFVMIGVATPVGALVEHARAIALAIPLVLVARALAVYPITAAVNRLGEVPIPRSYQHVMLWGGLHASIPIALALGLPEAGLLDAATRQTLRAMVFGVAAFSLVVQGLTMAPLLDRLGVVTRSETEELYELLVGRERAVTAALEAADRLARRGDLPTTVHEDFIAEYEREQEALARATSELLERDPELRRERLLTGERRILRREKSALMDAAGAGVVADEVGERLLDEVDLKLSRVDDGRSTVGARQEEYQEFWRARADEFGLDVDVEEAEGGPDPVD
jgi:CPA1 family monovalent cation:H+ antiporter